MACYEDPNTEVRTQHHHENDDWGSSLCWPPTRSLGEGGEGTWAFVKVSQRSKSKCLPNTKASVKKPKMGHASVNLEVYLFSFLH